MSDSTPTKRVFQLRYFPGWYESWLSQLEDDCIENELADPEDGYSPVDFPEELGECRPWDKYNYALSHQKFTKMYVDVFNKVTGLELEFESMTSPKYYNFETDRLWVQLPAEKLQQMFDEVSRKTLSEHIVANHGSYDGFISLYSNDLEEWLAHPFEAWDHNELATLFEAWLFENYETMQQGEDYEKLEEKIMYEMHEQPSIGNCDWVWQLMDEAFPEHMAYVTSLRS